MKLILQHLSASMEHEILTPSGVPLTNAQAVKVIDYAYTEWIGRSLDQPTNPTTAQKAALLLELMADHMLNAARTHLTRIEEEKGKVVVRTELG